MKKIILLLAFSSNLFAAGFQVTEHSSTGVGRAFAGDAVIADDASVVATNPAAMSLFKKKTLSLGAVYVAPTVNIEDHTHNQTKSNVAPDAIIPFAYYIHPINDQWAFGMGEYTSFGVTTKYPDGTATGAGETSLTTMTLSPSLSYRVNEHVSVGGGINLIYGKAVLTRQVGSMYPVLGKPSDQMMKLEGDDTAIGWTLGGMYELNERNRFGFSYHSETTLHLSGTLTDTKGILTGKAMSKSDGQLDVVLPAFAEFSGFHQLTPKVAAYYSLNWTNYSAFKELRATSASCTKPNACFVKEEHFKDNYRYSIGSTYTLNPSVDLLTGFAFDTAAGTASESIPDSNRFWYSVGANLKATDHLSYNLGFTYLVAEGVDFTEDSNQFSSESTVILASMQMNYIF